MKKPNINFLFVYIPILYLKIAAVICNFAMTFVIFVIFFNNS